MRWIACLSIVLFTGLSCDAAEGLRPDAADVMAYLGIQSCPAVIEAVNGSSGLDIEIRMVAGTKSTIVGSARLQVHPKRNKWSLMVMYSADSGRCVIRDAAGETVVLTPLIAGKIKEYPWPEMQKGEMVLFVDPGTDESGKEKPISREAAQNSSYYSIAISALP